MIKVTAECKDRFEHPVKKVTEVNDNVSVWTTNFPKLLKLTKKEK